MPHIRSGSIRSLGTLALLLAACGGTTHNTADRAGNVNQAMTVSPATAYLMPGQTAQFTANIPWEGHALWAVTPLSGGTLNANGLFTASGAPGSYTIIAMWSGDVRYTATAKATVLPPPLPAVSSPNLVSASGAQQASATGQTRNSTVVGEPVPAIRSANAGGTIQVRHGFDPSDK